jgi:hypothetical protein
MCGTLEFVLMRAAARGCHIKAYTIPSHVCRMRQDCVSLDSFVSNWTNFRLHSMSKAEHQLYRLHSQFRFEHQTLHALVPRPSLGV